MEPGELKSPARNVGSGDDYFERHLSDALNHAVQTGRLNTAVIATPEGLPLACSEQDDSLEILAGLSALFSETARRSEELLRWPGVEEVSLVNRTGLRLVARQFQMGDREFILVVVLPAQRAWRRVTAQAIRTVSALWTARNPAYRGDA